MVSPTKLFATLALGVSSTSAFTAPSSQNNVVVSRILPPSSTQLDMNLFSNAFKNDDSLGKPQNAGLKKGPNVNEITVNGKPVKAVAGQKVSQVMAAARVKMTYSCRKGNCGTCELLMNGRVEKACNAKIPSGKCTIQTY